MGQFATYYSGQDIVLTIDMKSTEFESPTDIIVDIFNNGTKIKTLKKSETDPGKQLLPVEDEPTQFLVRVFNSETNECVDGYMRIAITINTANPLFPDGRDDKYYGTFANFKKL